MTVLVLDRVPSTLSLYRKVVLGGARRGGELPSLQVELRDQRIDRAHLTEYNRVCGFTVRNTLPATYLHVLTFPLQMSLMTDARFPFALLGLVHVHNRIEQVRPVQMDEVLTFSTTVGNRQPHDKGVTFDLISEARVEGVVVWRGISTYLRRQATDKAAGSAPRPTPVMAASKDEAPSSFWTLPADLGRRYAAVSGDRNPIHLYALTAKLLGFPQAIAHGMWTKAAALAAVDGRLPDAFAIDVQFKLPVLLPAKLAFRSQATAEGGFDLSLRDARKGKPHLNATIRPL